MVLVAGATGGVGRRVVNILCNKGLPVRALVEICYFVSYLVFDSMHSFHVMS